MQRMPRHNQGFTLIEIIIVIVITGILGSMVAVFIKNPVDAYFASASRAALTDVADTSVRRMSREIHKALPNSLRSPNNQCIEFIPTKTGGRYRADDSPAGLSFDTAVTSFNMLGSNSAWPAAQRIADGDVIAVYNLGIPGADAYQQDNTATVIGSPSESAAPVETTLNISSKLFPLASGSNRFHVIPSAEKVVAFVCVNAGLSATGQGTGTLYRNTSSSFTSNCAATDAVVATQVSACNFVYGGADLQRNALVQLTVKFSQQHETVSLYHEVHANNTP